MKFVTTILAILYTAFWLAYKATEASLRRRLCAHRAALRRKLLTVYPLDHTMPRIIQFVYAELLDGGWWYLRPPMPLNYMPLYRVSKRVFKWNGEWYCETTLRQV